MASACIFRWTAVGSVALLAAPASAQVSPPTTTAPAWLALESRIEITRSGASYSYDQLKKLIPVDAVTESNQNYTGAAFAKFDGAEALIKMSANTYRQQVSTDAPNLLVILEAKIAWSIKADKPAPGYMAAADLNAFVGQLRFTNPGSTPQSIATAIYIDRKGSSPTGKGISFTYQKKCAADSSFVNAFAVSAPAPATEYNQAYVLKLAPGETCLVRILRNGQFNNGFGASDDGEVRMRFVRRL